MTASLSQISGFGSLWTAQSKYIIDFERGLVTHSKTLTKGQFNRWMTNKSAAQRPQLNPRQAFKYYTNYLLGQKFLLFTKKSHNNEMSKLFFQASVSYAQNHRDVFEKIENQLAYPVVQLPYGGFVRTKLERDNIVKHIVKIQQKANNYGMNWWDFRNAEEAGQRTYESLRDIAFKPRQQHIAAAPQSTDQ